MKQIGAISVWTCIVSLSIAYGLAYDGVFLEKAWSRPEPNKDADIKKISGRKLNVPVVIGGRVKGFVLLNYSAELKLLPADTPIERVVATLSHQVFKSIYEADPLVLTSGEQAVARQLALDVAAELGRGQFGGVVTAVNFDEFSYVSAERIRK